ncbi:MAG TPA: response regulator [Chitinophagaceae bacterium]|jgi:CheY-like chemotaxis protein|nr:response regulator [Chitinophagaceae bacterium]
MIRSGPVVVIEDDLDDQEILQTVFSNLGYDNEIIFFGDGQKALDYLNDTDAIPFLILSDINLPKLDGFALRDKIKMDERLQLKCIPYLFFTTASSQRAVIDAYSASVQGFFVKGQSIREVQNTISIIMQYWTLCSSPNNF